MRRAFTVPDATEAYVALEETMTSFALVRNGVLLAARDFAWGYLGEAFDGRQQLPREEIAARLAVELENFFGEAGVRGGSETQVCICGSLPELRTMTVPLMERLDLEVETLDSLFTIDAARLPGPPDQFLEQSAELRLAWAVAADWPQPLNLLRDRQRRQKRRTLAVAAVAAGVAAGVGVGWRIEQSAWWQSTASRAVAGRATPGSRLSTVRQAARAPKLAPATQGPRAAVAIARPLPPTAQPIVTLPPVPPGANVPPVTARPAVIAVRVVKPIVPPRVAAAANPPPAPVAQLRRAQPPQREGTAPREGQPRPEPAPLPFDAELGTILYSPDRKLAIIDGRIVQPDDDVRGARIVDITPTAVLLQDAGGRLRRLSLGTSAGR
jgi:hypothetical protein